MEKENRKLICFYIFIPFLLWPLTFIVFRPYFIYSMFVSTLFLSSITLKYFGDKIDWKISPTNLLLGNLLALLLYLIFYLGNEATKLIGLHKGVIAVYEMIYGIENMIVLVVGLGLIGLFEEIYWRGGLQGILEKRINHAWLHSTILYTVVHISTQNPVLVIASFVVGFVLSLTKKNFGLLAAIIAHIIWLELIIILFPPITVSK